MKNLQRALVVILFVACSRDVSPPAPRPLGAAGQRLDEIVKRYTLPPADHTHEARVTVPDDAGGAVRISDPRTHRSIRMTLDGAAGAPSIRRDAYTMYRGAFGGADVLFREHTLGVEGYVAFDQRPDVEGLTFTLDVSDISGLRFVAKTLEALDADGTPVLRMDAPWIQNGEERKEAKLEIEGCAYDENPTVPFGREVVAPGAETCRLHISWSDAKYPLIVDPNWTLTKSMVFPRYGHTMTTLADGKILVAGGCSSQSTLTEACSVIRRTTEIYDPTTNTFTVAGDTCYEHTYHTATLMKDNRVLVAGGCGYTVLGSDSGWNKHATRPCYSGISGASVYDPVTKLFKCPKPDAIAPINMTKSRSSATAWLLADGRVVIAGGFLGTATPGDMTETVDVFDPTQDKFTAYSASMQAKRANFTATPLPGGKMLIAGGGYETYGTVPNPHVDGVSLSSSEIFDPAGPSFTSTSDSMTAGRRAAQGVLLPDNRILIVGGAAAKQVDIYVPTTGWAVTPTNTLVSYCCDVAALHESGKVLMTAGVPGAFLWTPGTPDTVVATGDPAAFAMSPTILALANGKILQTGGQKNANALPMTDAQLYMLGKDGASCVDPGDCLSGICQNGVCCKQVCTGECQVCGLGTGDCTAFTGGELGSCAGDKTCSFDGKCRSKNAKPCKADDECASGSCADGVCCNEGCKDQCSVCTATGSEGICMPVTDTKGARPPCAQGLLCNGTSTTCVPALCDVATVHFPDGTTKSCFPFRCEANGACTTSCTSADQCAPKALCNALGKCVPIPPPPDSGGCSTGGGGALVGGALAWMFALVRRRRRR